MNNALVWRTAPKLAEDSPPASAVLANREPRRAEDGRLMYFENQLQFDRSRSDGSLDALSDDELRAIFQSLIAMADVCSWADFPLPCAGLPGFLRQEYDQTDEAGQLICIGLEYLRAVVFNERRTMHLRWREAREMIRAIRHKEREDCEQRWLDAEIERGRAHDAAAVAKEVNQRVYFIGSQSGPIKIGIAVNPLSRLSTLQTGHHEKLELLATCDGGQERERAYHKQFADRRLSGEWFERCPEIEAEIARLNNGDAPS